MSAEQRPIKLADHLLLSLAEWYVVGCCVAWVYFAASNMVSGLGLIGVCAAYAQAIAWPVYVLHEVLS